MQERPIVRMNPMFRSVAVAGLVLLAMTFFGCSKGSAPDASTKSEPGKAEQAQAKPAESVDEGIPPILRTPWKGDLDEIATRRVVRVLVPFRRPEFFYIDGQPAGILFEAFQDLERVINTTYKTKPGNHIVVVLVPTPLDNLRQRFVEGYGDIAAYSISITDDNKALVDFTKPTITGIKIVPVTGPGAPDLKSIEDLSGKEVWVHYQSRLKKDIEVLNAKLTAQGKSPAVAREIDPLLEPGDVMEMVNAGYLSHLADAKCDRGVLGKGVRQD